MVLLCVLLDDWAPELVLLLILISAKVAHLVAPGYWEVIWAVAERRRVATSSSKVSSAIHINIAPCQGRRLSLLTERLHGALIDLQKLRLGYKVQQLGIVVMLIFFCWPQQSVVDFAHAHISRCHAMRNCATKVGQMERRILDWEAGVAPLLRLMSAHIASNDVPRTHIIAAFARVGKDRRVAIGDIWFDFLSRHLCLLHHGSSAQTADRIRGRSVWFNRFSSVDWFLPIAWDHTDISVDIRVNLIIIACACKAAVLCDECQLGNQSLQALHILLTNKDFIKKPLRCDWVYIYFWTL